MEHKAISTVSKYLAKRSIHAAHEDLSNLGTIESGHHLVIPAYLEPHLTKTLDALRSANPPTDNWTVWIIENYPEKDVPNNLSATQKMREDFKSWKPSALSPNEKLGFQYLSTGALPNKTCGPGYARKYGMDVALSFLFDQNQLDSWIINLDADCTVPAHYFQSIESTIKSLDSKTAGVIFDFDHGINITDTSIEEQQAAMDYEKHLRYYIEQLKWCGLPSAFQTIGSAFGVRADAYAAVGGMNKRQAGEDFHFLQKLALYTDIQELDEKLVYPSPRKSTRVPFGTGRAIINTLNSENRQQLTYHPKTYPPLKHFLQDIAKFYSVDYKLIESKQREEMQSFLNSINFEKTVIRIKNSYKTQVQFERAFYQEVNGLWAMKYCHFVRDHFWPMVDIKELPAT